MDFPGASQKGPPKVNYPQGIVDRFWKAPVLPVDRLLKKGETAVDSQNDTDFPGAA